MSHTLNVELFFFNTDTDYLPHYRHFTCKLDESQSLKDLLKSIQEDLPDFQYPKNKTLAQINSILVDARIKIKDIVKEFGNTIRIEPASQYRATRDMRFNDDDFMEKYALLEPYCDDDDLKYYRTLYLTYYGSEALKYNQDYFGDSFFLLANRLLENGNVNSDAILDLVSDEHNGMGLYEYESNCFPSHDLTPTIDALKEKLEARRFINSEQMTDVRTFMEKIKTRFCTQKKKPKQLTPSVEILSRYYNVRKIDDISELEFICNKITCVKLNKHIRHRFDNFNIAFYFGPQVNDAMRENASTLLSCVSATELTFTLAAKACGYNILETAAQVAYKKAGNILLDAVDSNVDILIVDSEAAYKILDGEIKKCEAAVGREIDLQIITPSQLIAIATGTVDKKALGLDKSGSNITFI